MTYDEFLEEINNPDKIKQIDIFILKDGMKKRTLNK